jgi:hypothetical protein
MRHWSFDCTEKALEQHVTALVTRIASNALGVADQDVNISAALREAMGDTLRMLLAPPAGEHYETDKVECRPNHFTVTELAAMVRAQQTGGAAAQPSPGGGQTAAWSWKSMLRLIEVWTMQPGASLQHWVHDQSH